MDRGASASPWQENTPEVSGENSSSLDAIQDPTSRPPSKRHVGKKPTPQPATWNGRTVTHLSQPSDCPSETTNRLQYYSISGALTRGTKLMFSPWCQMICILTSASRLHFCISRRAVDMRGDDRVGHTQMYHAEPWKPDFKLHLGSVNIVGDYCLDAIKRRGIGTEETAKNFFFMQWYFPLRFEEADLWDTAFKMLKLTSMFAYCTWKYRDYFVLTHRPT